MNELNRLGRKARRGCVCCARARPEIMMPWLADLPRQCLFALHVMLQSRCVLSKCTRVATVDMESRGNRKLTHESRPITHILTGQPEGGGGQAEADSRLKCCTVRAFSASAKRRAGLGLSWTHQAGRQAGRTGKQTAGAHRRFASCLLRNSARPPIHKPDTTPAPCRQTEHGALAVALPSQ